MPGVALQASLVREMMANISKRSSVYEHLFLKVVEYNCKSKHNKVDLQGEHRR